MVRLGELGGRRGWFEHIDEDAELVRVVAHRGRGHQQHAAVGRAAQGGHNRVRFVVVRVVDLVGRYQVVCFVNHHQGVVQERFLWGVGALGALGERAEAFAGGVDTLARLVALRRDAVRGEVPLSLAVEAVGELLVGEDVDLAVESPFAFGRGHLLGLGAEERRGLGLGEVVAEVLFELGRRDDENRARGLQLQELGQDANHRDGLAAAQAVVAQEAAVRGVRVNVLGDEALLRVERLLADGLAEVALVLLGVRVVGHDEVAVARRVARSGEAVAPARVELRVVRHRARRVDGRVRCARVLERRAPAAGLGGRALVRGRGFECVDVGVGLALAVGAADERVGVALDAPSVDARELLVVLGTDGVVVRLAERVPPRIPVRGTHERTVRPFGRPLEHVGHARVRSEHLGPSTHRRGRT